MHAAVLRPPLAAGMISVIAHEITEAATDPIGTPWYDRQGNENADICAWQFGTISKTAAGQWYNTVDTLQQKYLIQSNLDPRNGLCVVA
jgi:hypothetical protein